ERWPAADALAAESPAEVIRAWAGLGYNRRALNLHRAAVVVAEEHNGQVPVDQALLRNLPGVGRYTASAIACFAAGKRTTVVDTNIGRVIARARLGMATPRDARASAIEESAEALLPDNGARDFNLALMDLGAMVCGAR